MAWNVDIHYSGPNLRVYHIESTLATDAVLVLDHNFGYVPLTIEIMPHNDKANAAGYWIDNETVVSVQLNKPLGGAGSLVHVSIIGWRHPH